MGAEWFGSELFDQPTATKANAWESTDLLRKIALYAS
jgi:hypothetical protein